MTEKNKANKNTNKNIIENANDYINLDFNSGFMVDNSTNLFIRSFSEDSLPHNHVFFELTYVTQGTIAHSVNFEQPKIMKKGDFILIDIGSIHEFAGIDKTTTSETLTLAFTGGIVSKKLKNSTRLNDIFRSKQFNLSSNCAISPGGIILHDTNDIIHDNINLLSKQLELGENSSEKSIRKLLAALLISIAELPQQNINRDLSPTTAKLINYIENHYNEQSLLNRIADTTQYSVAHLSNLFRWEMGIPFKDYLKRRRVEVSKQLINTTSMKLSDISSSVGYTDTKYFTRVFKEVTNMTPQQYKRTISKHIPIKKDASKKEKQNTENQDKNKLNKRSQKKHKSKAAVNIFLTVAFLF